MIKVNTNFIKGFDALFLGRVDEGEKKNRIKKLEMEMIWFGSDLPGRLPIEKRLFLVHVVCFNYTTIWILQENIQVCLRGSHIMFSILPVDFVLTTFVETKLPVYLLMV